MSLVKQIALSALILLALAGGGYWYTERAAGGGEVAAATERKRPVPGVEVTDALSQTLARRIEAVGTTRARQSVDVSPVSSGRVQTIGFAPGSQVQAGSTLVQLDDIAERADVAEAEAERRNAELALERARALEERRSIPQSTVEGLEAAFAASVARLDRAGKLLDERRIDAPFAGQVGMKQVDIGARVDDQTVITTLDDLTAVQVEFGVPEIFFGSVAAGQVVKATSAAFERRVFTGAIETVDSRIDPVSRSFRVRATIPNDDLALPAGMFMLVELMLAERTAVTVPEGAVTVSGEQASLYLVEDDKAVKRDVVLGQRELGLVEVVEGLEAGEQVIVGGIQKVRPGSPVRVLGGDPAADGDQAPADERGDTPSTEPSA